MKQTLTLSALFLTLLAVPAIAQDPSNDMFGRLQGGNNKPFGKGISPQSGGGCGGCLGGGSSRAPQSRAQSQMNVIMPMIFGLDLSPEQKSTIEKQLRTLQAQAGADPKAFETMRKQTLRAVIATLTADQRSQLLEKLAK